MCPVFRESIVSDEMTSHQNQFQNFDGVLDEPYVKKKCGKETRGLPMVVIFERMTKETIFKKAQIHSENL